MDRPGIKCGSCEGNQRFHPQHKNYSAASSPSSRIILLCPHPTAELFCSVPPPSHHKPKRNSEISELFFLKLFLVPFAQKNQKCHPQLQQSWVESSVLPQQQNYFAVPFPNSKIFLLSSPLPFTTKKKQDFRNQWFILNLRGWGRTQQNYSAVTSPKSRIILLLILLCLFPTFQKSVIFFIQNWFFSP